MYENLEYRQHGIIGHHAAATGNEYLYYPDELLMDLDSWDYQHVYDTRGNNAGQY
jgi:hypothetical protein